jgi:ATP-dependent DNA helicase RecG
MTIDQLKQLHEAEDRVEFKEARRNYPFNGGSHKEQADRRKCFLGYIVALSNEGGGILVLGMTDKIPHVVVGTDFAMNAIGALEDETYVRLSVRIHIEELFDNNNRVVVAHVPSRPIGRLMKFEGVALMRTGESLRNMSDEEMFGILSEQEPDFSAKICPGLSLTDLDEPAIAKMKEAYARKQENVSFQALSTEQVLSDLKLLDNGKLNYAALLLVGKTAVIDRNLPQAKTIWEFRFTESQIHNDFREVVYDPLFVGIDKIWALVNGKNGSIPVQSEAYIFTVLAFNEAVIREAILNAITHRDYAIGSEVVIKQYPKKLILNNPGGFPKGVNLDNLVTVSSTPRSRLMAEVLEKTGLVERSGQGIDKIFSLTLSEGKPQPDYQDSDLYQVTLKLYGIVTDKAFHVYITQLQNDRNETNKLGVEEIIALYKVKQGLFAQVKTSTIARLERENLISKSSGSSNRYALSDAYSSLAAREQRIGSRYLVAEVDQFLMAIQGKALKIGELEAVLAEALNRNQIKYLITKLFEDKIITTESAGRGTRYKIQAPFDVLRGDPLINEVLTALRAGQAE